MHNFAKPYSLGIIFGLGLGKPIGILMFCFLAVKLKLTSLPDDMNWNSLLGIGFLGGIGFTMSIFITLIAFEDKDLINNTKFMILVASLVSGIIGFIWLKKSIKNKKISIEE
jgi:Na+:H+ antiporter, NhaA family